MKWTFFIIGFGLLVFTASCEKSTIQPADGIVGEWILIEELMDPGDGSGTFQPVSSDKEIEFFTDGTFEANGDMCTMTNQAGSPDSGIYDTIHNTFSPNNCMIMAPIAFTYSVDNDELILSYPCICGCQQKYARI